MKILKNKRGFTFVELMVSMVLLTIVLVSIRGLVSNLLLLSNQNYYKNSVSSTIITENIQNDLIKYGIYYEEDSPIKKGYAYSSDTDTGTCIITFNTTSGKTTLKIEERKIEYTDVNSKIYKWNLTDNLYLFDSSTVNGSSDLCNIVTSELETFSSDSSIVFYKLIIPIYDTSNNENASNNKKENDIRVNFLGPKVTTAIS